MKLTKPRSLSGLLLCMQQGQHPYRYRSQLRRLLEDDRFRLARLHHDESRWRWNNQGVTTVMAADENGNTIIAGATNGDIAVWSPPNRPVFIAGGIHTKPITSLAISSGNTMFASASSDGAVAIWPLDNSLEGHPVMWRTVEDYAQPHVASHPTQQDVFIVWKSVSPGREGAVQFWHPLRD